MNKKKWLVLLWLLIPVGLLSYHYGPGQKALAWREAQSHFEKARGLEKNAHWEQAIDEYQQAMSTLPIDIHQNEKTLLARDQLRYAQIRARFQLGHLSESIDELRMLADEVQKRHGADSPLFYDIRDLLGRVHFQAMIALRLESAEEDVWKRQWELSRQNFRYLAERTPLHRNTLDRKNLEVVIKSADLPVEVLASASSSSSSQSNGFTPPTGVIATAKAPPKQQQTTTDIRQKTKQPNFSQLDPPEFILGN